MKLHEESLLISTPGRGLIDITRELDAAVRRSGIATGLAHVFVRHTSASLVIQENADPSVRRDLERWLERLAPDAGAPSARYEHDAEGPDDMAAHLRTVLTRTSETVPIRGGSLALGTWQAVYLYEHRHAPHRRTLALTLMGVS